MALHVYLLTMNERRVITVAGIVVDARVCSVCPTMPAIFPDDIFERHVAMHSIRETRLRGLVRVNSRGPGGPTGKRSWKMFPNGVEKREGIRRPR